ncbi:hypothetical protein AWJ20_3993 [Sugiyamaella lignohabitans]|uniref:SWI/SNF and RSC complexes subunit Ssr4 C-terminal domain-containing protein n=1 Tax=Sugiyamaella lignohabitans TaxID=796027 RepID=A0A161HFC2_9ASCO|nr:uncharacterized protein AWJ20_3993 [Sugiyamaella lignohabitans]ANB11191.1 hypothetical protein AWJ20_3993 [Sugiyamaella lignohabitans]
MDDANGGIGDELDGISLRDISAVRYVRHHEWLELVVGTAIPTHQIQIPKIFTPIDADNSSPWSFNDSDSVKAKLESIENEIKQLESGAKSGWVEKPEEAAKSDFYRAGIAKLREDFGSVSKDADYYGDITLKIETKFGARVIEKKRLRRVGVEVGDEVIDEDEEDKPETKKPALGEDKPQTVEKSDSQQASEISDVSNKSEDFDIKDSGDSNGTGPNINKTLQTGTSSTANESENVQTNGDSIGQESTPNSTTEVSDTNDESNFSQSVKTSVPQEYDQQSEDQPVSEVQSDLLSLDQGEELLLGDDNLVDLDGNNDNVGEDIYMEGTSFEDAELGDVLGSLPES